MIRRGWPLARMLGTVLTLAPAACGSEAIRGREVALPMCEAETAPGWPGAGEPGGRGARGDTLEVRVGVASREPVALLVRVDAPGESGASAQVPPDAPDGAAAAALSMTTLGVYRGCAAEQPAAIAFHAPAAPFGRAWLRVTTRRPVRAVLEGAEGRTDGSVVVLPGRSGLVPAAPPGDETAAGRPGR